jgi:multiple antibiotic resistance protein
MSMLELLVNTFIILFVVIDPVGLAPLFAALSHGEPPAWRRRMALRGVLLAAAILFAFLLGGTPLLAALGIGLPAFRIAGGALLFLLAIDMVFALHSGLRSTTAREQAEAEHRKDIAVFPLAIPLIAGPGAITTVLLLSAQARSAAALAALAAVLAAVLALALVSLLAAARLVRLLGETGANVVTRTLGVVLAALAVQFVLDGLRASF